MLFMQRKFQKPKEVYLKRIYKNQINFDLSKVHDQNVIKVFVKKNSHMILLFHSLTHIQSI